VLDGVLKVEETTVEECEIDEVPSSVVVDVGCEMAVEVSELLVPYGGGVVVVVVVVAALVVVEVVVREGAAQEKVAETLINVLGSVGGGAPAVLSVILGDNCFDS
jgi:hypothetical protein